MVVVVVVEAEEVVAVWSSSSELWSWSWGVVVVVVVAAAKLGGRQISEIDDDDDIGDGLSPPTPSDSSEGEVQFALRVSPSSLVGSVSELKRASPSSSPRLLDCR